MSLSLCTAAFVAVDKVKNEGPGFHGACGGKEEALVSQGLEVPYIPQPSTS